jgi:monoamine oxidase
VTPRAEPAQNGQAQPEQCDVVVVGAGIAGLIAARKLSKAGALQLRLAAALHRRRVTLCT